MTKDQLFKKYNIDETHNVWNDAIDNWMSVEIYAIIHDGEMPASDAASLKWVTDFLDKRKNMAWWTKNVMSRPRWGSLYLTAKRMVYRHADEILKEIN